MNVEPYPLRFLKNLNRGREIATVLLNYGFGDLIERLGLKPYLQWGRRLISKKTREATETFTTATRIRLALQDLGATFVKFGQMLSTRPDLLPPDIISELAKLQEDVPSFSFKIVQATVEEELGKSLQELFHTFDEEPLGRGSLAQVHRAVTHEGQVMAVKIRRPQIQQDVERDLSLLLELAQLLERHVPESKVFDPVGLVKHFTRTIRREMNFRREARTIGEFAKLFEDDPRLHVPCVYDEYCSTAILSMEYITGVKVDDVEKIQSFGIDPREVAFAGAQIFMRQAFDFGIFHGDPHPGNLRILPNGSLVMLDFGMIGFLDDKKRERLVDLFLSIVRHDVDRAVEAILELGQPSVPIERTLLQADVRDFIEAYYGIPLDQLDIGQLLTDFIGILSNHGLRCPGDLMLLIRAIITLEGVGRKLDPDFNIANVLSPFVEKMIRRRYDPKRVAERAVSDLKTLFKAAHDLPLHLGNTLKKAAHDDLRVQLEHRGLDKLISEFDRSSNRIVVGLVTSALVVSTALVIRSGQSLWIAVPAFTLSGLLGIWLIWGILRSGRL